MSETLKPDVVSIKRNLLEACRNDTMSDRTRLLIGMAIGKMDRCDIAESRVRTLEHWIECESEITNSCTFNILGAVCSRCRCGKAVTP